MTMIHETPASFLSAFRRREAGRSHGLLGRVARGSSPAQFQRLSFERGRRLAWVMGDDGLEALLGLSHRELVLNIGKGEDWLERMLAQGMRWRLFVFPGALGRLGNWDGVFAAIAESYPEVVGRLLRWEGQLRTTPFEEAVGSVGSWRDDAKSPDHPEHRSAEGSLWPLVGRRGTRSASVA